MALPGMRGTEHIGFTVPDLDGKAHEPDARVLLRHPADPAA